MALPTVVEVTNPRLAATAHEMLSVSEVEELPIKYACLTDAETSGGDCVADPCPGCSHEDAFFYVVEPDDLVPLQFWVVDRVNLFPQSPVYGWRKASPDYFVELRVRGLDGGVLWKGDIRDIADAFSLGVSEHGPFQSVLVNIDRMLKALDPSADCWYFELRARTGTGQGLRVDSDVLIADPAIGATYIDFATEMIMTWNGTGWEGVPAVERTTYYAVNSGNYYHYELGEFVGLPGPPSPELGDDFDTCRTFNYRLRRCDEQLLTFAAEHTGLDCAGFIHETQRPGYAMDPINGITQVDYWLPNGVTDLPDELLFPGLLAITPAIPAVLFYTGSEWVWAKPMPSIGSVFLVMNTFGGHDAGDVLERQDWVPFVGYWNDAGVLADFFPGATFDNTPVPFYTFQHYFRIPGSVEVEELPLDQELTRNGRLIRTTSSTRARVRSHGTPIEVVRKIQAVAGASSWELNADPWDSIETLRKNNEEGLLWWIDTFVVREDCTRVVDC